MSGEYQALERARSLVAIRRYEEALSACGPALAAGPTAAPAHCLRAQCLLGLNKPRQAQAAAKDALALDPDNEWAHRLLSLAYLRTRRRRAALAQAHEALRLEPRSVHGLHVLAISQLALRKRADAQKTAEAAVEEHPHEPLAHQTLATVSVARRNWETAERAFREGLRLAPDDPDLSLGLARLLHRRGRRDQAATVYMAAGRNDPTDHRARHGLARLGLPLAGAGALVKVGAILGARRLTHFHQPTRVALILGIALAVGAGLTTGLRYWGTRNLPDDVRQGLSADHRNAALRWLQVAAVAAIVLGVWSAAMPASKGGGTIAAVAFLAFGALAGFSARHFRIGPTRPFREIIGALRALPRSALRARRSS